MKEEEEMKRRGEGGPVLCLANTYRILHFGSPSDAALELSNQCACVGQAKTQQARAKN